MPRWLNIGQVFYKHAKREEAKQYPAILTEQAWSIKDLLNGVKDNYFLADLGHVARSWS